MYIQCVKKQKQNKIPFTNVKDTLQFYSKVIIEFYLIGSLFLLLSLKSSKATTYETDRPTKAGAVPYMSAPLHLLLHYTDRDPDLSYLAIILMVNLFILKKFKLNLMKINFFL